jgi:hypothetical protein
VILVEMVFLLMHMGLISTIFFRGRYKSNKQVRNTPVVQTYQGYGRIQIIALLHGA